MWNLIFLISEIILLLFLVRQGLFSQDNKKQ